MTTKTILKKIDRTGIIIEDGLIVGLIGGVVLFSVMQLVMRLFFNSGFIWADELIKMLVLWATLVASISASRENKHLKIDLISNLIASQYSMLLQAFNALITSCICIVISVHAFRFVDLTFSFDEKVLIIKKWSDHGLIAKVHPYHLIFSIWSLTQHYADFDVQIRAVLTNEEPFENAESYLINLFSRLLRP